MEEKDIRILLISWYDDVISLTNRVNTGNVSHQVPSLKNYLLRISIWISKHHPDDELGIKHSKMFNSLAQHCDRITTGNVSHEISLIRGITINYKSLFEDILNNK